MKMFKPCFHLSTIKNVFSALAVIVSFSSVALAADQQDTKSASDPIEVSRLIKCHEGKFDLMNAVSQLNADISKDAVYGWSGIGAYPDGHLDGDLIVVRAPFSVSAPTFVTIQNVSYACVTVSK